MSLDESWIDHSGHVSHRTAKSALLGDHDSAHFLTKNPSKKWLALDGVCEDYVSHWGPLLYQGQGQIWNMVKVQFNLCEGGGFLSSFKNKHKRKQKQYLKKNHFDVQLDYMKPAP